MIKYVEIDRVKMVDYHDAHQWCENVYHFKEIKQFRQFYRKYGQNVYKMVKVDDRTAVMFREFFSDKPSCKYYEVSPDELLLDPDKDWSSEYTVIERDE